MKDVSSVKKRKLVKVEQHPAKVAGPVSMAERAVAVQWVCIVRVVTRMPESAKTALPVTTRTKNTVRPVCAAFLENINPNKANRTVQIVKQTTSHQVPMPPNVSRVTLEKQQTNKRVQVCVNCAQPVVLVQPVLLAAQAHFDKEESVVRPKNVTRVLSVGIKILKAVPLVWPARQENIKAIQVKCRVKIVT